MHMSVSIAFVTFYDKIDGKNTLMFAPVSPVLYTISTIKIS